LTDHHQIECKYYDDDFELINDVGNTVAKIQDGGRRYPEFRKTVVISLQFDQSSSNLVSILLLDLEHIDDVEKAKYP